MLYTNEGNTRIEGSVTTVLTDLTIAIKSVKECLEEREYDEEFIRENIAECGRLAFMTEAERKAHMLQRVAEIAKEVGVDGSDIQSAIDFLMEHPEELMEETNEED